MRSSAPIRRLVATVALAAACLWESSALAQVDAQLAELNAQALEAYQNLDIEAAIAKLQEAIALAEQSGYAGRELAVSYINLGVVYTSGLGDREQGGTAFVGAICADPTIEPDPLLSTPEVQQLFQQARQHAMAGACPTGAGAPAPAPYPTPAPQLMPTQLPPSSQTMDEECPPGMVCDEESEDDAGDDEPGKFARAFIHVGVAMGFTLVQSGMTADSDPPLDDVIDTLLVDLNADGMSDAMDYTFTQGNLDTAGAMASDDFNGDGLPDNRYYFDDRSAWVPDADSFDDFEDSALGIPRGVTPVSTKCSGDGTETGPPALGYTEYLPSKYCVRVEQAGVVQNVALRLAPGYFVADTFALSLPVRFQFNAGEGSLSHMLIGLRGELLFSEMDKATGFPVSWFFGATYGQIQAKPPPRDPNRPAPYVISGPLGAHTGVNVRWRAHENFGLILSPEIDLQFPEFLLNADLMLGAEAAF